MIKIVNTLAVYCGGVAFSYWVFSEPYKVASEDKKYPPIVYNYYNCKSHMVKTFSKPALSFTWPWSLILLTSGTLISAI